MKQEDKDLLLRYLSMALPYDVYLKLNIFDDSSVDCKLTAIDTDGDISVDVPADVAYNIIDAKPYLRHLASMTEEELVELNCLCYHNISVQDDMLCGYICGIEIDDVQNFLLHYHFDFMGLIPRDLAIAVTEENNPYNTTEE